MGADAGGPVAAAPARAAAAAADGMPATRDLIFYLADPNLEFLRCSPRPRSGWLDTLVDWQPLPPEAVPVPVAAA